MFKITRRELPQDSPGPVPDFVRDDGSAYTLYVRDVVAAGVREYASQDPLAEVGGVLLGRHYRTGDRTVVVVDEHSPVRTNDSSVAHFTFDANALREIRQLRQTPEKYIVGWFHSHPCFGDPFMSGADLSLHRQNFAQPWYVSCVVAGGQWSLPLGFWRVEDGRLRHIGEYCLIMGGGAVPLDPPDSSQTRIGEPDRRLFRASVGEERPFAKLAAGLDRVIRKSASPAVVKELDGLLSAVRVDDGAEDRASPLGWFGLMVELARSMSERPALYAALRETADQLRSVRFLPESLPPAFRAPDLGHRLAVYDETFCCVTPGERRAVLGNFRTNRYVPLRLGAGNTVVDAAFAPDGVLWLLLKNGELASVPEPLEICRGPRVLVSPPSVVFHGPCAPEGATQVVAADGALFVRAGTRVLRFPVTAEHVLGRQTLAPAGEAALPSEGTHIMGVPGAEWPSAVELRDGGILVWNLPEEAPVSMQVPSGREGDRILSAAWCSLGPAVILAGKTGERCLVLDLPLRRVHTLLLPTESVGQELYSVASDASGRLLVRWGMEIGLLLQSGAPHPEWYHFRAQEEGALARA